jgi:hypothetical protein
MAENWHQIGYFSRKHTWVLPGCFLLWHHQQVIVYTVSDQPRDREAFFLGFILFPRLPENSNFAHRNSFFISHVISLGLVRTCNLQFFSAQFFFSKKYIFFVLLDFFTFSTIVAYSSTRIVWFCLKTNLFESRMRQKLLNAKWAFFSYTTQDK